MTEYSKILERVEKDLKSFAKIAASKQAAAEAGKMAEAASRQEKEAADSLNLLEEQEKQWQQQAEKLSDTDSRAAILLGQQREIRDMAENLKNWQREEENCYRQRQTAENAQTAYIQAQDIYIRENEVYTQASSAFFDAQAGILAKKLQPGQPCPVCGSVEHPHPHQMERASLTKEELDVLAQKLQKLQKQREKKSNQAEQRPPLWRQVKDLVIKWENSFTVKHKPMIMAARTVRLLMPMMLLIVNGLQNS